MSSRILKPGFQELSDAQTMLAFLKNSPLTLDYCKNTLKIEGPLSVVKLLNNLGKQVGFNIQYSKSQELLTFIDTRKPEKPSLPEIALRFTRTKAQQSLCALGLKLISQTEFYLIGSKIPRASLLVDKSLVAKDYLQQRVG